MTAAKLAHFITSVEAQEVLLNQRKRDYEARAVFALMEGTHPPFGEDEATHQGAHVEARPQDPPAAQETVEQESRPEDDDIYEDF